MRRLLPLLLTLTTLCVEIGYTAAAARAQQTLPAGIPSPVTLERSSLPAYCRAAQMHLTLRDNGSADVEYLLSYDKQTFFNLYYHDEKAPLFSRQSQFYKPADVRVHFTSEIFPYLSDPGILGRLCANAMTVIGDGGTIIPFATEKTVGFTADKHLHDLAAVNKELFSQGASLPVAVSVKRGFFSDQFQLAMETGNRTGSIAIYDVSNSSQMSFLLTMPACMQAAGGILTRDKGRTVEWIIDFQRQRQVRAECTVTNTAHVILGAVLVFLLFGALTIAYLRNRRKSEATPVLPTAHPGLLIQPIVVKRGAVPSPFTEV